MRRRKKFENTESPLVAESQTVNKTGDETEKGAAEIAGSEDTKAEDRETIADDRSTILGGETSETRDGDVDDSKPANLDLGKETYSWNNNNNFNHSFISQVFFIVRVISSGGHLIMSRIWYALSIVLNWHCSIRSSELGVIECSSLQFERATNYYFP